MFLKAKANVFMIAAILIVAPFVYSGNLDDASEPSRMYFVLLGCFLINIFWLLGSSETLLARSCLLVGMPAILLVIYIYLHQLANPRVSSTASIAAPILLLGTYFAGYTFLRSSKVIELILSISLFPVIVSSIYAFIQFQGRDPFFMPRFSFYPGGWSSSAFFCEPNHLAYYLALFLPTALVLTVHGKWGFVRMLCALSFLLGLIAILCTHTRGAYVAVFVSIIYVTWMLVKYTKPILREHWGVLASMASGTILVILPFMIVYPSIGKKAALFMKPSTGRLHRDIYSSYAIVLFKENLIFGAGLGAYNTEFNRLLYSISDDNKKAIMETARSRDERVYAYNEFLQVFAELGLCGGFLMLWIITSILKRMHHVRSRKGDAESNILVIGANGGLVCAFVLALVSNLLHFPFMLFIIVLFSAISTCNELIDSSCSTNQARSV